jgi:hypothetical protein
MREMKPQDQLLSTIIGSWVSQAIYVAAKLRLADRLSDGPLSAEEITALANAAPRPLYRLLRALEGLGVFARDGNGWFQLNALAELLRDGGPESLRALSIMIGEEQDRCWDDLCETVRTGETAFASLCGRPVFDFLGEHPQQAAIFDAAMIGFSGCSMHAMLDAFDLSSVGTLADIGGGLGSKLAPDGVG